MEIYGVERVVKGMQFRHVGYSLQRKTLCWNVEAGVCRSLLGEVKWSHRWVRYCFFPVDGSYYDQNRLRGIADFCEEFTRRQKEGRL